MRVNLVLIGPPGGGKGTQALRLTTRFGIPHISTGDMLRQAIRDGTPLGREVDATIARGELVSDDLMIRLVRERLAQADAMTGFILDGFPRTQAQAEELDRLIAAPLIVAHIDVPAEAIIRRLRSRRICESCGITQSVSDPDAPPESCPYCGGTLVRRNDDDTATVQHRLANYAAFAEPVVAFYEPRPGFIRVDGLRHLDEVTHSLVNGIRRAAQRLSGGGD
jgi:adenylate kinase